MLSRSRSVALVLVVVLIGLSMSSCGGNDLVIGVSTSLRDTGLLDEWGAREKGHTLAAHLLREYGLSPWWAQAVTIRWEFEQGLRG